MQKIIYNNIDELLKASKEKREHLKETPIPTSIWIHGQPIKNYFLVENKLIIEQIAYECPQCGVVKGRPKRTKNKKLLHSRNQGVDIDCYACHTHLGEAQFRDE
jgi:predicted RNA-binding Zn-ribbon protein involved in translation (DUF1610 family)